MGNTLTCCVSPNASPKLGRRSGSAEPDYESEVYEAAAGDAVAVAPAPAAPEPAEIDFGAGEGHHLQHISDREMPEGKEAASAVRLSAVPGRCRPQGPLGGRRRLGLFPARSRLFQGWVPGTWAGAAWRPHPIFFPCRVWPVSVPLHYTNAQFFPVSQPSQRPQTSALPVYGSI